MTDWPVSLVALNIPLLPTVIQIRTVLSAAVYSGTNWIWKRYNNMWVKQQVQTRHNCGLHILFVQTQHLNICFLTTIMCLYQIVYHFMSPHRSWCLWSILWMIFLWDDLDPCYCGSIGLMILLCHYFWQSSIFFSCIFCLFCWSFQPSWYSPISHFSCYKNRLWRTSGHHYLFFSLTKEQCLSFHACSCIS